MENCLAAAALNGVDRRALQRTARLGREVLERARTRAADWRSAELPRSSVGALPASGPQPAPSASCRDREKKDNQPSVLPSGQWQHSWTIPQVSVGSPITPTTGVIINAIMKYYSSVLEEGGAAHVSRYHRGKSAVHLCWDMGNGQKKETSLNLGGISQASECALAASQPAENISKDLYIEVYPGTYSVTVGTSDLTRTQVVAVDSGQSVDLVFPI